MKKNKPIEIEGEPLNFTDYEAKYNRIVKDLQESVFDGIKPDDYYDIFYTKNGDEVRKRHATQKNELKPVLTPSMVDFKLQSIMRRTMPMDEDTAKALPPETYLEAFYWYFELMYFCSSYITLSPNKQGFCAFAGITVSLYNSLLGDIHFCDAFNSIEDGLLQNSFVAGESGLVDGKVLATRLGAEVQGHALKKAETTQIFVQNNKVDKLLVQSRLDEFTKMIGGGK